MQNTRENAYNVFKEVLNDLDELIEGSHSVEFATTDYGVCFTISRNWGSNIFVYFACLFEDCTAYITIENTTYDFQLDNDELETVIESLHDWGYF